MRGKKTVEALSLDPLKKRLRRPAYTLAYSQIAECALSAVAPFAQWCNASVISDHSLSKCNRHCNHEAEIQRQSVNTVFCGINDLITRESP